MNITNFLKELKYSYHKNELIFMEGSCFRLYCMLREISENAKPYYSELDGHWITEIDKKFYHINGEINKDYVEFKNYKHITNETILKSAYIPTYKRQCTSYNKYN